MRNLGVVVCALVLVFFAGCGKKAEEQAAEDDRLIQEEILRRYEAHFMEASNQ